MAFAAPLDTSIHVILPMQETLEMQVWSLGWEAPLEESTAISSVLAWRIPGTEEPGGLQSIGSQRVGHNWSDLAHMPSCQCCGEGKGDDKEGKIRARMGWRRLQFLRQTGCCHCAFVSNLNLSQHMRRRNVLQDWGPRGLPWVCSMGSRPPLTPRTPGGRTQPQAEATWLVPLPQKAPVAFPKPQDVRYSSPQ